MTVKLRETLSLLSPVVSILASREVCGGIELSLPLAFVLADSVFASASYGSRGKKMSFFFSPEAIIILFGKIAGIPRLRAFAHLPTSRLRDLIGSRRSILRIRNLLSICRRPIVIGRCNMPSAGLRGILLPRNLHYYFGNYGFLRSRLPVDLVRIVIQRLSLPILRLFLSLSLIGFLNLFSRCCCL